MKSSDVDATDRESKGDIVEEESEDLEFEKKEHNKLYNILKNNPIDPLNDKVRNVLDRLDILDKADAFQWWLAYIWAKPIMRLLWNYRVQGELAPEYGHVIFVGNLQSHLDPFFIGGAVHRRIQWMSKPDNFKTPIIRSLFKNLGGFEHDEDNPDPAFEKARQILEKGDCVGIFPEGTRSEDGTVGEFKPDAVRLAIETGVPICPTAVLGSFEALPKGKSMIKTGNVTVRIGKAIEYTDYYEKGEISYPEAKKLSAELRQEVINLIEGEYIHGRLIVPEELSIGSPKDMEEKPKMRGFMSTIKKLGKDFVRFIDDAWYAFLRSTELVGMREHLETPIYNITGHILTAYTNLINPIRTIGFDKYMPKEGGALIASGHNSEWDVLMLPLIIWKDVERRELFQMAKQSLFKVPFVNAWVRTHHAFPLRREQTDVGSYLYAKERLEEGRLVVVYPEGTTNTGGGQLLPGHTGSVRLAIDAKVPIIPVGVTGSEYIFPKHAKMLNFGKGCIFKCGEAFMEHQKYFDKPMPNYEELKRLTDNMMLRIKDLLMYDVPDI